RSSGTDGGALRAHECALVSGVLARPASIVAKRARAVRGKMVPTYSDCRTAKIVRMREIQSKELKLTADAGCAQAAVANGAIVQLDAAGAVFAGDGRGPARCVDD